MQKNTVKSKVIYPKYSKHWPYTVAHTIDCVCSKMLNHGLNHGLFLSLFKLIPCPINWIAYVLAYLNFIFEVLALPKTAGSAQTHKSISFIWIVWSTLYVYLCLKCRCAKNTTIDSHHFTLNTTKTALISCISSRLKWPR